MVVYEGLVEVTGVGYQGPPVLVGPGYMLDVPGTGIPAHPQRTIEYDDRLERGAGRDDDSSTRQRQQRTGEDGERTSDLTRTLSGEHESPDD